MKNLKNAATRRMWFLLSIGLLLAFAIAGQFGIDKICFASESGQFWGYEGGLHDQGITITVTIAAAGLFFLLLRFFPVKKKVMKILSWVLGIILCGWMLFFSVYSIYRAADSGAVYRAAGLWIEYVDRGEEERNVWDRSRWLGHGDEVYEYSYDEFKEAHSHLYPGHEDEEPYRSILAERYKMERVFAFCYSETMINVLSYFYGKWVWLLYSLLAACSVLLGASMLPMAEKLPGRLLFLAAWILFVVFSLLPALNGLALASGLLVGPLFTGIGLYYWQLGAACAGPAIGIMFGVTCRKKEKAPVLENTEDDSPVGKDSVPDIPGESVSFDAGSGQSARP